MEYSCVKQLVESGFCASSIPPKYVYYSNNNLITSDESHEAIPTVDFSMLTSRNPEQRSKAIEDLGRACRHWGFFIVRDSRILLLLLFI